MTLASDFAALQSALTAAGILDNAPFSKVAPPLAALSALSQDFATAITAVDAQIASGMDAGGDPALLATYLTKQVRVTAYESLLLEGKAFVDRMEINLSSSVR